MIKITTLLALALASNCFAADEIKPQPVVGKAKYDDILKRMNKVNDEGPFKPNYNSFKENYKFPDWFKDAKFGLWIHWGAQTKPARGGGWYARHMYLKEVGNQKWGLEAWDFHRKTFGHQSKFGFKDVCNAWKAEKYDADALVGFFKKVGAKYVAALAVHHDNFDNWDSDYQKWNSVNIGPKRDIVGEFAKAARKYELPLCLSSHANRTWEWQTGAFLSDTTGPLKGVPYDGHLTKADGKGTWWEGYDPAELYGPVPAIRTEALKEAYDLKLQCRMLDLIEKYKPDMLYFDGKLPLGAKGLELGAFLYNSSIKWHGYQKSVLALKKGKLIKKVACIRDFERGGSQKMEDNPWQTDTTPFTWFYKEDSLQYHNTETIIECLADYSSKNGNLLLNVDLLPDGSIPKKTREILEGVGTWLALNGESIYKTRPWKIFGEGPVNIESGHYKERRTDAEPYTPKDFRFTTTPNTIYALAMAWPKKEYVVTSFAKSAKLLDQEISKVTVIGLDTQVTWELKEDGLHVAVPEKAPCKHAFVLKVELKAIN